jgi:hypothetical protein
MADLVGTCPKDFWEEWIAEGDAAGEPETGEEWDWFTKHSLVSRIKPGDRFYIVAHGKLRGYAIVTRTRRYENIARGEPPYQWGIVRKGGAVACTIDQPIPGFRGLRLRWWKREEEKPFPDWKMR